MNDVLEAHAGMSGESDASARNWAAGAHLAAMGAAFLTSWSAGIAGAVAAFVVWLIVRDRHPFAAAHAKEALNFNLSMLLYALAACALAVVLVGATIFTLGIGAIVTVPAGLALLAAAGVIAVMWLLCSIIATVKAFNGEDYRYPLTFRLF
ncbi:DUF4870 domain-containing protein [Lysobacter brunescens]|jgi:uncharacterized Tic20 family protein|uniref:DUF4870 domain-containing protein n=1 Tax=Lysobacter brunescens TaxID=262323 RepID=A0ABW2YD23_9GAMM